MTCAVGLAVASCSGPGSVEVDFPTPKASVQASCRDLVAALPETVADDLSAREIQPGQEFAAAWGDPPVVLRCGVDRPVELTRTSACFEVNGVGWFVSQQGREVSGDEPVEGPLTFTTIGRAPYVEVTVPSIEHHQPVDPLPALAAPIKETIPLRHPCH